MKNKELEASIREVAKSLQTENGHDDLNQILTKITVGVALNADLAQSPLVY